MPLSTQSGIIAYVKNSCGTLVENFCTKATKASEIKGDNAEAIDFGLCPVTLVWCYLLAVTSWLKDESSVPVLECWDGCSGLYLLEQAHWFCLWPMESYQSFNGQLKLSQTTVMIYP